MNLPFIKNKVKIVPENREYLVSLEIGGSTVRSAIWTVVNGKPQVVAIGDIGNWKEKSEELLDACDKTISSATEKLDESGKFQPVKTILGIPVDWTEEEKIKPEKLIWLKELTKKLVLKPVGFVITPQAIVKYLHQTEGVPSTAIILGIEETQLVVTLARMGIIESIQTVKRSDKLTADLIEGLTRFNRSDMLPSRIMLYDSFQNLEDIRQVLLAYPWQAPQNKLPFLHFPKIEILPANFSVKAISLSGGVEVATAIGLIDKNNEAEPNTQSINPQDLGFVAEQDIARIQMTENIPKKKPVIPKWPIKMPVIKVPKIKIKGRLGLVVGLILLGLGFWSYWYLPKATVKIFLTPNRIDKQLKFAANAALLSEISVTVNGQKTLDTTGNKLVGDKAIGEIVIVNGTGSVRKFPAGTQLTANSGLKFVTDNEVDVASASGTADPNSYQPGKSKVRVTATDIGSDYNLTGGTEFKIGSFSPLDFVARNETAFTGGSSRQERVVSDEDLANLKRQLEDELMVQGKNKIIDDNSGEKLIIEETIISTIVNEKSDFQTGEKTDKISLDMTITTKALGFVRSDLDQLIIAEVSKSVPQGYERTPDLNYVVKLDKDGQNFTVDTGIFTIPVLDINQIIKKIAGKKLVDAEKILTAIGEVDRIEINIVPKLPTWMLGLPHVSNNIKIETMVGK